MENKFNLKDFSFTSSISTRWKDLDAFQHVNNAVFASYVENARVEFFMRWGLPSDGKGQSIIVASLNINYIKQVKHPSELTIGQKITKIGNTSFVITSVVFDDKQDIVAISEITSVCFDFDLQHSVPVYDKIKADYNK